MGKKITAFLGVFEAKLARLKDTIKKEMKDRNGSKKDQKSRDNLKKAIQEAKKLKKTVKELREEDQLKCPHCGKPVTQEKK